MFKYVISIMLLSISTLTLANQSESLSTCFSNIQPFSIEYNLKASILSTTSEHKLKNYGNVWIYNSQADAGIVGSAKETSLFKVKDSHFELNSYTSYRRIALKKEEKELNLNWIEETYNSTEKSKTMTFPEKGAHVFDRATQQLAIQCLLKDGHTDFKLTLATFKGLESYHYKVTGEEIIETPKKKYNTLKVEQVRDDDREVYFWLSPELDYAPIAFVYKEDGDDTIKATLKSFRYL